MNLDEMVAALETPGGGFTVRWSGSLLQWEPVTRGFSVSTYPDEELVHPSGYQLRWQNLANYIVGHADQIKGERAAFGGWHDEKTGKVYLDLTTIVNTMADAWRLAAVHRQLAFYDLEKGATIYVTPEQTDAWIA